MQPHEDDEDREMLNKLRNSSRITREASLEAERKAFVRHYVILNAEYYASSEECVQKACELCDALQEAGC